MDAIFWIIQKPNKRPPFEYWMRSEFEPPLYFLTVFQSVAKNWTSQNVQGLVVNNLEDFLRASFWHSLTSIVENVVLKFAIYQVQ